MIHDTEPATDAAPAALVAPEATPDVWRAIVAVMMEAPVPGKIVGPLVNVIQAAMTAAGHAL